MRYDRGIRVMLPGDIKPGKTVWVPDSGDGKWLAATVLHREQIYDEDGVVVEVEPQPHTQEETLHFYWRGQTWKLRHRDPARQGRDYPKDDPSAPALKPRLKKNEVCKLGILTNGDIIGRC